jgi:hypothetical protein
LNGTWGVDLEVREISLAIDTPDGIGLVVGYSHPTIEKIVEATRTALNKPVHLVLGGTHLLPAKDDQISSIAASLRDNWNVRHIAPGHCTGEPAFTILKQSFGDRTLRRPIYASDRCDKTVHGPCPNVHPVSDESYAFLFSRKDQVRSLSAYRREPHKSKLPQKSGSGHRSHLANITTSEITRLGHCANTTL